MYLRILLCFALITAPLAAAISKKFDKTALFIETKLAKHIAKKQYYLPKRKTGLPYTLEYDPVTKKCFILLKDKKAFIGKGKFKKVYKAILYSRKHPKIVARAEQSRIGNRERAITAATVGLPGIVKTVGSCQRTVGKKQYSTFYSKLYRPGSLYQLLEHGPKVTLKEKMKIAKDILKGLASLHMKGIAHKDLGPKNYLVNLSRGKPNRRKIEACIVDFGQAIFVEGAVNKKVQGNIPYTAPEGIWREKLKEKDYFLTDIFAVGCVFYRLFYNHAAPWLQVARDLRKKTCSADEKYQTICARIKKATHSRRQTLSKRQKLSAKEEFELLILRMVEIDPSKRGQAKELSQTMRKIYRTH